mmetsp:Transcript_44944/g.74987  ORF Transcript_44944/g.74987 Transcript_44944/m.74987 type:complete len:350 (+) Transcript_44944:95-1144(+)
MERYKLYKRIGQGTFGKIYLARLREAPEQDPLVIKVCPLPREEKERKEVLGEVAMLSGLHHPCLTRCLESFVDQDKNQLFIVMPHYASGDLSKIIEKNKTRSSRLPEPVVLEWFVQLLLAVEHLHARRTLHHCSVKSGNVFLTAPGGVGGKVAALLGDFGVARVLEHSDAGANTQCGTPYYMSPELIEGVAYNHKSDIWALGCVLYEMLTLRLPFPASSMAELGNKVLNFAPPPLDEKYSAALRAAAVSMLEKDPKKRPNAEDLLQQPLFQPLVKLNIERWNQDLDLESLPELAKADDSVDAKAEALKAKAEAALSGTLPTALSPAAEKMATIIAIASQKARLCVNDPS